MMPLPGQSGASENETCWTLIHAAADGSQTALSKFAERYQPAVRRSLACAGIVRAESTGSTMRFRRCLSNAFVQVVLWQKCRAICLAVFGPICSASHAT